MARPNIAFAEEEQYSAIVDEAKELKATITGMLKEDKVSLPAMREVIAKIELVPVNFENEVDLFQKKMLSAQNWLAKARKCIPKRRVSRRGGGSEPKKMDLDAIRALVDDAPCDDSAEMFEMQDLLECADEWAEKVKQAIEGGAEIQLDELKELFEEGNDMPVEMEEQKYLEAEIAAREWCVKAASMLAARKSLKDLERVVEDAKSIRTRIHPKKQSRWKPQVERDIHAAIDTARRWVNEVRDVVGQSAFDKLLSSSSSSSSSEHSSHSSSRADSSNHGNLKAKKPLESIARLLEKSERLVVNVSSYIDAVKELQANGYQLQDEVRVLLVAVGCRPPASKDESQPAEAVAPDGDEPMSMASSDQGEKQEEPHTTVVDSTTESVELGDFLQASALLDRVYALPFHFEEGLELESVIVAERDWSQRVKDALPPRQSRKKRQSKNQITLEQLEQLLWKSKELHFRFPEEMKTLERELEELNTWQIKARDAVETPIAERMAELLPKLKNYDLRVYEKLQAAKKKLAESHQEASVENGEAAASVGDISEQSVKYEGDQVSNGDIDVDMTDASLKDEGTAAAAENDAKLGTATSLNPNTSAKPDTLLDVKIAEVLLPIDADAIMSHLRFESGCMQKQKKSEDDDSGDKKASSAGDEKEKPSLLDPVLVMAEKGLEEMSELEFRDERINALETIELSGDAESSVFTDEAVKILESWRDQIAQVVEEGELLSAVAPELQSLTTVVDLLTWLQNARSLFYDEMLPLRELVTSGNAIANDLKEIRSATAMSASTMETLELMLWPLPHLETQDQIVQSWTERVSNCISDKRVKVKTLQSLMDEGGALLMEADAFKIILDEVKKAKSWLSKLKKRLKALITKRVGRLSINTARSFVEEGEDIVIEIPVFDHLKENVEMAGDWETRVLESGLDTGTARIANLVSLLNEYDCAGLVIDMDMHREVLKSATERYCICRQPFDGLMIGCDFCDDWFHDNCIGMSKEKAEKVENYTCPSCTILQDLSTAMQQVINDQKNLWSQAEYVKSYEKQHGVLTRKLKREEKAVEKGEVLLLSCNNQMNQLKSGIEEIERTKSKLTTTNHQVVVNAESSSSTPAPAPQAPPPVQPTATAAMPVKTPNQSLQNMQRLIAPVSDSAPPQENGGGVTAAVPPPSTEVKPECATTAPPTAPVTPTAPAAAAPAVPAIAVPAPAAPAATPAQNGPPANMVGTFANLQSVGFPHLYPSILLPPGRYGSALHPPISVLPLSSTPSTGPAKQLANGSANAKPIAAKSIESKQSTPTKSITMSVNRLAALVAAGDIEQQLPKLRTEHAELMVQVHDAQESLRLSKDRLELAQVGLRDLRNAHIARELGLPVALAWVRKAVIALNTTALLSRSKLLDGGFVPAEYESIIAELTQSENQWTAHINNIFPEVRTYVRLLRLVGWSFVVVALLQERPSRESLSSAIAYAVEHNLWESKTVSPLKGVLGRMDSWLSKVHKSMLKPASKAQKLPRLKLFMNEYSKLPLTCGIAETLEEFVKVLEMDVPTGDQTADQLKEAQEAGEAAVVTAFAKATAALSASHAAASTPSTAQPKPPRKRKPYTRKEKQPGAAAKKSKKNPSSVEGESMSNGNSNGIADLAAAAAAADAAGAL